MANQSVSIPATVAANAKLVDPGIKAVIAESGNMLDQKLSKVLKVENMSTAYEEVAGYTGLGGVPQVREGEEFSEDAMMHTFDTTFVPYKYGQNLPISYELLEDDLSGAIRFSKLASEEMIRKAESLSADIFNRAFDPSFISYGDGLPLCSTAHPRADGGSNQSNADPTGITLTEANLEVGILAMRGQLNDRGGQISIMPDTLLVPPALEKEALIITKSSNRSGTADNDINVNNMSEYSGGRLKVIVWDYLGSSAGGSDTAWFLLDSRRHELTWKWRKQPSVKRLAEAVGAKNQIAYWQMYFRAAYGWSNWKGVWGSKGDTSPYTS